MKKLLYIASAFIAFCALTVACSNDEIKPDASDKEIADKVVDKVCTDWNTSMTKVRGKMKDYIEEDSGDNFLQYVDKNDVVTIRYEFFKDSLAASVAIVPELADININDFLKGYTRLGLLDDKEVFYNKSKNTLVLYYKYTDSGENYSIIGYTPYESKLYRQISPIEVTTGNYTYNSKNMSVTLEGNLSGITTKNYCSISYSTDPDFTNPTTKSTTTYGDFSFFFTGLKANTTYYYRAVCRIDDIYYTGETRSFTTD